MAAVVGGLVRYLATPVGPYAEVLAAVAGLDTGGVWGTVSFMAVDSAAGLVAGRLTWGLPKTLGVIEGSPRSGTTRASGSEGGTWRISVAVSPLGPWVPLRGRATLRQPSEGTVLASRVTATGRMRPAVVRVVESDGPPADWLRPGRRPGVVLTDVRLTIGEPSRGSLQL